MDVSRETIYLDNAATSWPKPPAVREALVQHLELPLGGAGRGEHAGARLASGALRRARAGLARLLGLRPVERVVFTLNATHALNLALKGLLRPGSRVVTSSLEHNSVLRPLAALQRRGVQVLRLPYAPAEGVPLDALEGALRQGADLVVLTAAGNVTGHVPDLAAAASLAHAAGARLLVDASQAVGHLPFDAAAIGADLVAFSGHKGLLGPSGTGALYVAPGIDVAPLLEGGTGTHSESLDHPSEYPDRLEAGTPNALGIAGLAAAVDYLLQSGVERIAAHEASCVRRLWEGLAEIPGVRLYGPAPAEGRPRAPVVSFTLGEANSHEIAYVLDAAYGIATRGGLQCAPAVHQALGTLAQGCVRVSPGWATTADEVEAFLQAMRAIASQPRFRR